MVSVVQQSSPSHTHQISVSNVHIFDEGTKEGNKWGVAYVQWKQTDQKRAGEVYLMCMQLNAPFHVSQSFSGAYGCHRLCLNGEGGT